MNNTGVQMEYEKAIDYIFGMIQNGDLTVGSKLPTERAIAQELNIGRNSTREASCMGWGWSKVCRAPAIISVRMPTRPFSRS